MEMMEPLGNFGQSTAPLASIALLQEFEIVSVQSRVSLGMWLCQNHDRDKNEAGLALTCRSPAMKFRYAKVSISKKLVVMSCETHLCALLLHSTIYCVVSYLA